MWTFTRRSNTSPPTAAVRWMPQETGARRIKVICILAAEPGARAFAEVHPDVPVFTAAVDAKLNDHGYIVPGLGDAGDRLFGTK